MAQLLRRPDFDDPTTGHDGDLVGHRHLGQPVSHHEGGPSPDGLGCGMIKSRSTGATGFRRRLIKDDDGRVCQQCARQSDLLCLGR